MRHLQPLVISQDVKVAILGQRFRKTSKQKWSKQPYMPMALKPLETNFPLRFAGSNRIPEEITQQLLYHIFEGDRSRII
jgi:hypothetical protein